MTELKELCEHALKEAEAFHRVHHSPPLTAERLAKAVIVLSEALERMVSAEYPTEDAFSAEQALIKANEIARGEQG